MGPDREFAERTVARALNAVRDAEVLVVLTGNESAVTRFSENTIHQNMVETNFRITARVAVGKKVGVAAGNVNMEEDAAEVVRRAAAVASAQREKEDYAGLAAPAEPTPVQCFDEATAAFTAEARAAAAGTVIKAARSAGMKAAGMFATESYFIAVGNSRGVFNFHAGTQANLVGVVMADNASGYCQGASWAAGEINVAALAEDAVRRAELAKGAREIKPGRYDLVVEPYAIGELFTWMAFVMFDTKATQEGRTILSKRFGERIMGENITIVDDGLSLAGLPLPFDFEGVPRRRVTLVDKGVAVGLCYDLATAARAGKESTGHALPLTYSGGPVPLHLQLLPGNATVEEMIAALDGGLYVTRFHYVNGFVEPMQVVFTGMTRDGAYWVEGGKIKYAVKNMRWTESMLRAFSNVKMLGREVRLVTSGDGEAAVAPAVYFEGFNFTGTTEH